MEGNEKEAHKQNGTGRAMMGIGILRHAAEEELFTDGGHDGQGNQGQQRLRLGGGYHTRYFRQAVAQDALEKVGQVNGQRVEAGANQESQYGR